MFSSEQVAKYLNAENPLAKLQRDCLLEIEKTQTKVIDEEYPYIRMGLSSGLSHADMEMGGGTPGLDQGYYKRMDSLRASVEAKYQKMELELIKMLNLTTATLTPITPAFSNLKKTEDELPPPSYEESVKNPSPR